MWWQMAFAPSPAQRERAGVRVNAVSLRNEPVRPANVPLTPTLSPVAGREGEIPAPSHNPTPCSVCKKRPLF